MKIFWHRFTEYFKANFYAEQTRLIAWLPFGFALGIALYFSLPFEPPLWLSCAVIEIWLLLFYLLRHHNLHLFFVSGLLIISGFINIQLHTVYQRNKVERISEQTVTYLRGQIADISISTKGKPRLLLQQAADYDKPLAGNFRITVNPSMQTYKVGQCVEMVATLFPPHPMPILHGFALDRKYFYEGLSATGYANSEIFVIDCETAENRHIFSQKINSVRQKFINYINATLPPQQSGIANAILFGEKSYISSEINDNYRNSGLAHFLAVSGLHLGTIAALIFFIIRLLCAFLPFISLRFDSKKIAAVGAIIFSFIYLLFSGMAIPAQRAFIMTTVILLGVLTNRQAISLRMVSFAALVLLIIRPYALISVSFQMSFAAVFALVVFYEKFSIGLSKSISHDSWLRRIFVYLLGIVICDLVASLATAPFALYHFHRLALYTSLGNLSAGPLIGIILMPLVLVCLLTIPLGIGYYPLKALGSGIFALNQITDYVAHLPHSVLLNDNLSFMGFISIVCGGYWLCIWQRSWRWWGIIPIIFGLMTLFFPKLPPDMAFSPKQEQIAIRDENKHMIMLPLKKDSWLSEIWNENLNLQTLSAPEKKKWQSVLCGVAQDKNLQCTNSKCIYQERITFNKNSIWLDNKKIDNSAGGYIYINNDLKWQPLWNNKRCRLWQNCKR